MAEIAIAVENLAKRYGDEVEALSGVSFTVEKGDFFVIMGPSGCGKTTLLKCLAGLLQPDSGSIRIHGKDMRDVPVHKRDSSLIFENFALFPHLTVYENVTFGLGLRKFPRQRIKEEASAALELVGLTGLEKRFPRELSGGQKQRVALARSLVLKPSILYFDEPLASLDYRLQRKMEEELKLLHQQLGLTFVYVTHNQEQAMSLGDHVMIMNSGLVEQISTPQELYSRPRTVFVARFVGEINVIPGTVLSKHDRGIEVKTALGTLLASFTSEDVSTGANVVYAVRPENVRVNPSRSSAENEAVGRFRGEIYRGSDVEVLAELQDGRRWKAVQPASMATVSGFRQGDSIKLSWSKDDAIVLAKASVVEGINIEQVIYGA